MGMSRATGRSMGVALPGSGAVLAQPAAVSTSVSGSGAGAGVSVSGSGGATASASGSLIARDTKPDDVGMRTCVRLLTLRVEFVPTCRPVPGWEQAQRGTCGALGRAVLDEAVRRGLRLELWTEWLFTNDPSGFYWLAQWKHRCRVRDNAIDQFARGVQDAILTPAVGSDRSIRRVLALANSFSAVM